MKAKSGDKIQLTNDISYGSVYGLIKLKKETILTVADRNSSNDGVKTKEEITLKNEIGQKTMQYNIWDEDYRILN